MSQYFKYSRTMHLPWSPGTTSDDKIMHDISPLLGKTVVITEKMDGENNCFVSNGVFARSHVEFTTSPWSVKVRELHSLIRHSISEGLYIFGEGMSAIHSIEYETLDSHFYIFGIRDNNIWLSWDETKDYAFLLDIPTVPKLFDGVINTEHELQKITEVLSNEPSFFGGQREGVVVRLADSFTNEEFSNSICKFVRKGHVQTDSHWTKNWRFAKINSKFPHYL